jgi:dihydroorotate dehydrogenase
MDLYRAMARPALFALRPETAHRIALATLALPIPWERLVAAVADPALRTSLAGIDLENPIGLAAGFDKTGGRLDALGRLGFGFVVVGTFTRRPRKGNQRPTIVRYARRSSIVNAMGLPNPGADAAARTLAATPRTSPRFASIADENVRDVVETHALLEPHVDAIELNASCPNVSWGRDRDDEAHLSELLRSLRRRAKPLFVKLPPFRGGVERDAVLALVGVALDGGADGLVCSNTRPVREPRLSTGEGGLSGRALFSDTPRIVEDVVATARGSVPVAACGGVFSAADALACMNAGATTIQIYSSLIFEGPGIVGTLTSGLAAELSTTRASTVRR